MGRSLHQGIDRRRKTAESGEAGPDVPVAGAWQGQVDGEDQNGATCSPGPGDEVAHVAPVLQHVELEPGWGPGGGHLLDRADPDGGEAERDSGPRRRPGGLDLAPGCIHAGHPHRGKGDRHGEGLPEEGGREVHLRHVAHHPLAQGDGLEVADIPAEGLLSIGPAIDVLEEHGRQASPGEFTIVRHGGGLHRGLPSSFRTVLGGLRQRTAAWVAHS